jgi:tetratricopeptide (TPR) repeat protein
VRSIRLANIIAGLTGGAAACFFMLAIYQRLAPRSIPGITFLSYIRPALWVYVIVFAYSYLLLMYVGKFDPVVAWAVNAWQKADYTSALLRLRLFSWGGRRAPFTAFLLTSANFPDRAYAVATNTKLPETDMEEPSYNLDFAAGRAALAQGNLEQARLHFESLYDRFPSSALARYALGDLLLWQNIDPRRAHQLLTDALADPARKDLPHWTRLGFEAELRASHAWSLAVMGRPEDVQYDIDEAIRLSRQNQPVRASVHLRLGYALRALEHFTMAYEHWRRAREIDPHGWAGCQAARELEDLPSYVIPV